MTYEQTKHLKPAKVKRLCGIRLAIIGILTFTLIVGRVPTVWGQISTSNLVAPPANELPEGVMRFGAIEVAPVKLEGEELFADIRSSAQA